MPGIPEIIGEVPESGPELMGDEQVVFEEPRAAPTTGISPLDLEKQLGAMVPPLIQRLEDFSGMGERAPPG